MSNQDQSSLEYEQAMQLLDDSLIAALQGIGLPAQKLRDYIVTDLEHLFLRPSSVGIMTSDSGAVRGCSFGIDVAVQHPDGNKGRVTQAVANFAGDAEVTAPEVLADLARKWTEGVLPPLCRLFGAENGEIAGRATYQSYTEGDAQITLWEGFVGKAQFWGDETLRQVFDKAGVYRLVNDTLTGCLSMKRLLWVDIQGARYADGKTSISVEINNHPDEKASAEASYKFDWTPVSGACSFRQFLVVRPHATVPLSEAKEDLAAAIKEHQFNTTPHEEMTIEQEEEKPASKRKFRLPFGRRPT